MEKEMEEVEEKGGRWNKSTDGAQVDLTFDQKEQV
jgi:hypothetical protein